MRHAVVGALAFAGLGFVIWLDVSSHEQLWVVIVVALFLYFVATLESFAFVSGLGSWRCEANRHKLTWLPDVPSSRVVHGAGIPLRSYIVLPGEEGVETMTVTMPSGNPSSFKIALQQPVCRRCGVPLPSFQARRKLLGWAL